MVDESHSPAYRAIRRQFEFAGETAGQRLERLEDLLRDIQPTADYPIDWLVFRVTGITPEASSQPEVIPGDRLLGELVSLLEDVDRKLGPRSFDPEVHLDAEEVARRLGVSRRTLQRWRSLGLPMRRFRHSSGVIRAGVRLDSLVHFRSVHAARIERAGRGSRLDAEEREGIVELVHRLESDGVGRGEAVAIASSSFGRSRSAIRSVLDDGKASKPSHVVDRLPALVARARSRLVPRARLAERLGRTEETIRRQELDARAAALVGLDPDSAAVPNLERADASEVFAAAGMLDDLARSLDSSTPEEWLRTIRALPEEEDVEIVKARIAAMHFARAVAVRDAGRLEGEAGVRPGERLLDPIETMLRWWGLLLERNTISGLSAGLRRLEQSIGRRLETLPPRRLRTGLDLLLSSTADAIRHFDPSRRVAGHDLDRAVGLVVARRIAASPVGLPLSGAHARGIAGARMPVDLLTVVPSRTRELLAAERWWRLVSGADRRAEIMDADGWEPLSRRFGFETPGRPRTLVDLGGLLGLPATRFVGELESATRDLRRVAIDSIRDANP